jgi:hypothetical protein
MMNLTVQSRGNYAQRPHRRGDIVSKKVREAIGEVSPTSAKSLSIEQPKILEVALEVEGTADLIQNNFGQKSIEQMLRKHMGFSVQRENKRPRDVLEAAKIKNTDGRICVPAQAFKSAMITASTQVKGLKMKTLRTQLFVVGAAIPITYETETPRMDMVRTAGIGRQPDVRFRPAFGGWKARIVIQYADTLATQTVVDLLHRAGKVGVGEWRPEKNGVHGTFRVCRHIDSAGEIGEINAECAAPLVSLRIPEWAIDADIDPEVLSKVFAEQGEVHAEEEGAAS